MEMPLLLLIWLVAFMAITLDANASNIPDTDDVKHLVTFLEIRNTSITASSKHSSRFSPQRVRMDRYLDGDSCWSHSISDHRPWVQFDMEQRVTVWGVVLKRPLNPQFNVNSIFQLKVVMSDDTAKWRDVSGPLETNYRSDNTSVSWFDEAGTARYWRIELLSWSLRAHTKADLLGQPEVSCPGQACIKCNNRRCLKCQLGYTLTNDETCVVPNLDDLKYLVISLNINKPLITTSSQSYHHSPEKVRLDCNSLSSSYLCGWRPFHQDVARWVQFDMEQMVFVWGIAFRLLSTDSSESNRVKPVKVLKSDDGHKWCDSLGVIRNTYPVNQTIISWFERVLLARYWRIQHMLSGGIPIINADLIGERFATPNDPHCVRSDRFLPFVCEKCEAGYTLVNRDCRVPIRSELSNLTSSLNINDASISASSEYSLNYTAKFVRMDRYLDLGCAWRAAVGDPKPWVQFDMQQEVRVWGVVVKRPCDGHNQERVKSIRVTMSLDATKWREVTRVLRSAYDSVDQTSTAWFDEALIAQYWRIHIVSFHWEPSMKADLIGETCWD